MAAEVERLLGDGPARAEQLRGLEEVRASLGAPGAPRRVAEELASFLPRTITAPEDASQPGEDGTRSEPATTTPTASGSSTRS
jgi:hypothetical protein